MPILILTGCFKISIISLHIFTKFLCSLDWKSPEFFITLYPTFFILDSFQSLGILTPCSLVGNIIIIFYLSSEFGHCLVKKKCPTCHAKFDTETKLMMHIGCTHREVHKYLPDQAKDLMPGVRTAGSPVKVVKTPIRCPAPPTNDLFQKFTEANPPSKR